MPILEIETSNEFYDFDGKYTPGKSNLIAPARLSNEEKNDIEKISKEIFRHLKCKGCIRIDIIIKKGVPFVLEMNTSPGLTELSDIPAQARSMGINFQELMLMYLNSAED